MKTNTKWILAFILTGLLMGCSQGFEANSLPSAGGNSGQDNGSGGNGSAPSLPPLDLKSYISGGSQEGTLAVDFDKTKGDFLFLLPLGMNGSIEIDSLTVPQLPGVQIETYWKNDQAYLALRVPSKYITRGVTFLNPGKLPNGNALPGIADGELPRLSIQIKSDVYVQLYIGVNVIAVFIETPFDPYINMTLTLKNEARTKITGYFATIAARNGFPGGFYLTTTLPPDLARILDDHFGGL